MAGAAAAAAGPDASRGRRCGSRSGDSIDNGSQQNTSPADKPQQQPPPQQQQQQAPQPPTEQQLDAAVAKLPEAQRDAAKKKLRSSWDAKDVRGGGGDFLYELGNTDYNTDVDVGELLEAWMYCL